MGIRYQRRPRYAPLNPPDENIAYALDNSINSKNDNLDDIEPILRTALQKAEAQRLKTLERI